jgi:acetyltransferase-like isoleucine patch superfamily enzyme
MKKIKKIIFKIVLIFLKLIQIFSIKWYMYIYIIMLKFIGVNVTGKPKFLSTSIKYDLISKISIGDNVVISDDVILLTHDYSINTALIFLDRNFSTDAYFAKEIVIGNNVFIGMGSIILPGSIIMDNTIIGAGSTVRGVITGSSIYLGNPAINVGNLEEKAERWLLNQDKNKIFVDE